MKTLLTWLCLLSASASCALAPTRPSVQPFTLPVGELKVTDLVDRCAAYLGRNILIGPNELLHSGVRDHALRLQQPIETNREGCEELLANLLWSKGLALVEVDAASGTLEVIALLGPRAREVGANAKNRTVAEVLARPNLKVPVTTTIDLQHSNANAVINGLRPFLASTSGSGGQVQLGAGGARSIVVSGAQDQVAKTVGMIRGLDVQPMPGTDPVPLPLATRLEQRLEALEQRIAALAQQLAGKKDM
ncbi:MAG: hypothetical protein JNK49_13395 [Planctomycetes bacterium]|nr:hypothetical protein [Planctomycetota bacterium]